MRRPQERAAERRSLPRSYCMRVEEEARRVEEEARRVEEEARRVVEGEGGGGRGH